LSAHKCEYSRNGTESERIINNRSRKGMKINGNKRKSMEWNGNERKGIEWK
jgi:hypothetical protein